MSAPLFEVGSDNDGNNQPLNSMSADFRDALEEFREHWQHELKQALLSDGRDDGSIAATQEQPAHEDLLQYSAAIVGPETTESEKQEVALNLFRKAVELEQRGKVYDAVPLYRKAVQIVPDIEYKFYDHQKAAATKKSSKESTAAKSTRAPKSMPDDSNEQDEELVDDLYEKFELDIAEQYKGRLLLSSRDANVLATSHSSHISDLPPEIILYILRWVVSNQLDMRSLEQCAAVSKGMYLCARDEDLWRLACIKVWGANVGCPSNPVGKTVENSTIESCVTPTLVSYNSWRHMFVERERILFNGCYISKTTYLRMGENSFQDQYYRPIQLVEYYRYLRFLPDGTVFMMTNADEPAQGVAKLRHLQQLRPDVLKGHYRLYGNTVTILLKKQQQQSQQHNSYRLGPSMPQYAKQRRGSLAIGLEDNTKYCIELQINSKAKRKFVQLIWLSYSIIQLRNKIESVSQFDLTPSKYPPLMFSPVRSYHLSAESPLA